MVLYKSVVFCMIGVLQICTANPITSDPAGDPMSDATKLYSNDQIQIAKTAGVPEKILVEGKMYGFTFDEILKIYQLIKTGPKLVENITFEFMTNVCSILDVDHKTAASYTDVQETQLRDLIKSMRFLLDHDQAPFIRSTLCAYISQPDVLESEANSFGLAFVPYMDLRYLKLSVQTGSDVKRVRVTKDMCCIHENLDKRIFVMPSKFKGFSDEDLNAFDQHWNEFVESNTLKSFENVCDFLHTKIPDDECVIAEPIEKE